MSRLTRILLGAAAGALLLVVFPTSADAGVTMIDFESECNADTGDFDLTFTIVNGSGADESILVTEYQIDGADRTPPTFVPNPMPGFGQSTATDSVPGSATSLFLEAEIGEGEPFLVGLEEPLDGDCEADPTTTTSDGETTTSTATAAAAATQPRFTG